VVVDYGLVVVVVMAEGFEMYVSAGANSHSMWIVKVNLHGALGAVDSCSRGYLGLVVSIYAFYRFLCSSILRGVRPTGFVHHVSAPSL